MTDGFVELHGDRLFGDDEAMVAGLARLDGRPVAVVGQQKGADTDENVRRNFGMPHPEGYRKAMRVMELAERFGLPVITFVDVPGAHPGPESEERGIAEAIARSVALMTRLRTPIVTVITGEGGSGGALAIAVGDVVIALENAVYSVISPEGCASILWRSTDEAATAAAAMRMTAGDQRDLGVIDLVVAEPGEGAHTDPAETARRLRAIDPRPARGARGAHPRRARRRTLPTLPRRWAPTLRPTCRSSPTRSIAASAIACGTCWTRAGEPSAPPSSRGRATTRRRARRSSECPDRHPRTPTPRPSVPRTTPRSTASPTSCCRP